MQMDDITYIAKSQFFSEVIELETLTRVLSTSR